MSSSTPRHVTAMGNITCTTPSLSARLRTPTIKPHPVWCYAYYIVQVEYIACYEATLLGYLSVEFYLKV